MSSAISALAACSCVWARDLGREWKAGDRDAPKKFRKDQPCIALLQRAAEPHGPSLSILCWLFGGRGLSYFEGEVEGDWLATGNGDWTSGLFEIRRTFAEPRNTQTGTSQSSYSQRCRQSRQLEAIRLLC